MYKDKRNKPLTALNDGSLPALMMFNAANEEDTHSNMRLKVIVCHAVFWYCGRLNLGGQVDCNSIASDEGKEIKSNSYRGIQQPREEEGN